MTLTKISSIDVTSNWVPFAALAGYCVATAVSATWVSFSFTGISGPALTFVTFLIAQLVFLARAGHRMPQIVRFARANTRELAVLNVLTLASWLFMFMALQRLEASVESTAYQGAVAVVVFVLTIALTTTRYSSGAMLGMATAVLLLGVLVWVRLDSTSSSITHASSGAGLVLALVGGATGGVYVFRSSRLHRETGVETITVLCTRFLLLLVVTGVAGADDLLHIAESDLGEIARLVAVSIAIVVVPTFLLQYAIVRLPAVRVSTSTPFVPIIALGSEYVVHPWANASTPLIVVAASIVLVVTNLVIARESRVRLQNPLERNDVNVQHER